MSVQSMIAEAASRYGVPVDLALAVARRESNFDQNARGALDEIGVFQLRPGTAAEVGVDPFDLAGNIEGGMRYLRKQFDRFGDWATALMAYNGGPGNVQRGTVSDAAQRYSREVLAESGPAVAPAPLNFDLPTITVRSPLDGSPWGAAGAIGLALAAVAVWGLIRR